jgi:glycosyltransferase involved in cell wall biosynthesis
MRIAFLTGSFPTEKQFATGLATYMQRVVTALREQGHEPEVFTLSHETGTVEHNGILVHRVATRRLTTPFQKWPGLRYFEGYTTFWLQSRCLATALRRRHREKPFNIAQASNSQAVGLVAARWGDLPLVTRISSHRRLWNEAYKVPKSPQRRQKERMEILQLRASTAVYGPSQLLADLHLQYERIPVRVVEPPFFLETASLDLSPPDEEPADGYGIFFGAISRMKGCDRIVNVLPALFDRNPGLRFLFVGPLRKSHDPKGFDRVIRQKLAAYAERYRVLPPLQPPELFRLVHGARFVALPSKIDNLPNACMEAMALSRVVIASRGASFEQLITDGESGFLVPQEDDAALEACIERVWRMPVSERGTIGAAAAQAMKRLEPRRTVADLVRFYKEVLSGGVPSAAGATSPDSCPGVALPDSTSPARTGDPG